MTEGRESFYVGIGGGYNDVDDVREAKIFVSEASKLSTGVKVK